ncbi:MAG: hypothetical protein H0U76_22205 [Ktedonobacteraceae bacterium]|nr:hypothetical protein [Ktedonobacteraceae bacterium]
MDLRNHFRSLHEQRSREEAKHHFQRLVDGAYDLALLVHDEDVLPLGAEQP